MITDEESDPVQYINCVKKGVDNYNIPEHNSASSDINSNAAGHAAGVVICDRT